MIKLSPRYMTGIRLANAEFVNDLIGAMVFT